MLSTQRIATAAVTAALGVGALTAPALGASSTRWSSGQCQTWQKAFVKRNAHATTKRKAEANKVLKGKGCSVRVK
ncbi:MAG TPA: hypothetical protein VN772_02390 [Solirubrobacteraceae bacterium]|nr:hypothetical protein [Solirubrobacteraceae bacterium]